MDEIELAALVRQHSAPWERPGEKFTAPYRLEHDELAAIVNAAVEQAAGSGDGRGRDLAMMIRMLCWKLGQRSSGTPREKDDAEFREKALQLLERHGLQGSPLRASQNAALDRLAAETQRLGLYDVTPPLRPADPDAAGGTGD